MNCNCIENHNNNISSNFIIIPLLSKILWFTRHFPGRVVSSKNLYLGKVCPFLARATVGTSPYVSLRQSVSQLVSANLIYSLSRLRRRPQNEDDLKNEDYIKNKDDLKMKMT